MKRLPAILVPISSMLLLGCEMSLPVEGQLASGNETFSGVATGQIDGSGTIQIVSSRGRKCDGVFVYVNNRQGSGTFTCSSGDSGNFEFVSTGTRGTGIGVIGGKKFTFRFG